VPDTTNQGVSRADFDSQIAAITAQLSTTPSFVTSDIMTVESLHSAYPPSAAARGKYARVNNYGSSIDKVLRCDFDTFSGLYYWTPSGAPQSVQTMAMTGNFSADPLISGDVLELTGTIGLGVTRTLTLGTARGRPGDMKTIKNGLSSLLGGLNILGLGLGSGIASLIGSTSTYVCQWDTGTSALKWTRLT